MAWVVCWLVWFFPHHNNHIEIKPKLPKQLVVHGRKSVKGEHVSPLKKLHRLGSKENRFTILCKRKEKKNCRIALG